MAEVVVVTGASGFAAGELVKQLLEKGYTVRGTVRSLDNKEKTKHLVALGEALPGKLELHAADLLKDGSFDDVVEGAHYVFHAASPFFNSADDPQRELVDPALQGTQNVLTSVAKHKKSVKRVVLTSSLAAMLKMDKGPDNGKTYTQHDWNTESSLDNSPYMYSKTLAEQKAWDIAKSENLDLVTIHPAFVIGPILSARADGTSIESVISILESKDVTLFPWFCDVRDVARAHIRAAELKEAHGRYLVAQYKTVNFKHLTDVLKKEFPQFKIKDLPDAPVDPAVENRRALSELGLSSLYEVEESIIDMARTLLEKGLAKPQKA